jgi:hypothetical protein
MQFEHTAEEFMKMLSLLTFVVLSVVVVAQSSPMSDQPKAEQQVRRASDEEVQAFLHNDAKSLARLWSDDLVHQSAEQVRNEAAGARHGAVRISGHHLI